MKRLRIILLVLFILPFANVGNACNNSSMVLVSQVTNPDGSITYTLNLTVELGGLDAVYYGSALSFNSPFNTPTVIIGGTYPTTTSVSQATLTSGTLTGTLQGLTAGNINTVVGDSDWNPYMGDVNVLSFESSELFGAASNDISFTIQVTVMGCVESITFDSSVNSGSASCEKTVSTGQSCAPCSISAVSAGTQSACNPGTNTYTQGVTVTYTNAPASGTLNVNGQSFAITSSPQTVTLTNLAANGNSVNVTAQFSANLSCTLTSNGLFTAPPSCSTPCTPDNGTWD